MLVKRDWGARESEREKSAGENEWTVAFISLARNEMKRSRDARFPFGERHSRVTPSLDHSWNDSLSRLYGDVDL